MIMPQSRSTLRITLALLLTAAVATPAQGQTGDDEEPAGIMPAEAIEQQVQRTIDQLREKGDFQTANEKLTRYLDWAALHVRPEARGTFVNVAFHRRLVQQLATLSPSRQSALLPFLLDHPKLARELVFLKTPHDNTRKAYDVLRKLKGAFGERLAQYPGLTAALCWVHDGKYKRHINGRPVTLHDPVKLFAYYAEHRSRMIFDVKSMPGELLVWVVSVTRPVEELRWSLARYQGKTAIGRAFFDIEYDTDRLREGEQKAIAKHPYTLPNIREYGGVCADQTYYATSVSRAIGVPAAYVTAQSAGPGHAWVGFLHRYNDTARWNFATGRYGPYQGLRGRIQHPQTRRRVTDSRVGLLAKLINTTRADRLAAAAATDAVRRIRKMRGGAEPPHPNMLPTSEPIRPLTAQDPTVERALTLLKTAVEHNPASVAAWQQLVQLARTGSLALEQKRQWTKVVNRLVPARAPAFMVHVLRPMIETVSEPQTRHALWNRLFEQIKHKPELAAEVRLAQARLWENEGDFEKAGKFYLHIASEYVDDGPFAVTALKRAENLLRQTGRSKRVLKLYRNAWTQLEEPEGLADIFKRQSNWYRIGKAYADSLDKAGHAKRAQRVRQALPTRDKAG
jgi:tetratricopeptide (TPR) repeat protein